MSLHVGDRIMFHNEDAIVCHEDPPIARTLQFHSYVWLRDLSNVTVTEARHSTNETIRAEVVNRIQRYIEQVSDAPTGCE